MRKRLQTCHHTFCIELCAHAAGVGVRIAEERFDGGLS